MKLKIYLFRFVVALTAFILGVSFINAWQAVDAVEQTNRLEVVAVQQALEITPAPVMEVPIITSTSITSDLTENVEYEFDAGGSYYVINDLPKSFKGFQEMSIRTYDYTKATEENEYQGIPIPPDGSVFTNKEYKFTRINIANRQIAFETEAKKGISYKFVGKFVDNVQRSEDDYADLEGQLIKMRDGKKIAETKIRLAMGGC